MVAFYPEGSNLTAVLRIFTTGYTQRPLVAGLRFPTKALTQQVQVERVAGPRDLTTTKKYQRISA